MHNAGSSIMAGGAGLALKDHGTARTRQGSDGPARVGRAGEGPTTGTGNCEHSTPAQTVYGPFHAMVLQGQALVPAVQCKQKGRERTRCASAPFPAIVGGLLPGPWAQAPYLPARRWRRRR